MRKLASPFELCENNVADELRGITILLLSLGNFKPPASVVRQPGLLQTRSETPRQVFFATLLYDFVHSHAMACSIILFTATHSHLTSMGNFEFKSLNSLS